MDVLKAATSNVSKAFQLGDRGFVREGASADLLLVKGDPTSDVSSIENIVGIWNKGARIR